MILFLIISSQVEAFYTQHTQADLGCNYLLIGRDWDFMWKEEKKAFSYETLGIWYKKKKNEKKVWGYKSQEREKKKLDAVATSVGSTVRITPTHKIVTSSVALS